MFSMADQNQNLRLSAQQHQKRQTGKVMLLTNPTTQMQENAISVDDLGKLNLGEGPKMRAYLLPPCPQSENWRLF